MKNSTIFKDLIIFATIVIAGCGLPDKGKANLTDAKLASNDLSQKITPSFSRLYAEYDYPRGGVEIGQGWDSFNQGATPSICVVVEEAQVDASSFSTEFERIHSSLDLKKHQSVSAKLSAKYGSFKGSASFSRDKKLSVNTDSLNLLFTFKSNLGSSRAVGIPSTPISYQSLVIDKEEISKLSDEAQNTMIGISDQRARVHNDRVIRFSNYAENLLSTGNLIEFKRACGDGYTSSISRGAEISILMTYDSRKREEQDNFLAAMAAKGFGVDATGNVSEAAAISTFEDKIFYRIDQKGGIPVGTPTNFAAVEKILINTPKISNNPSAYSISITPYSNLGVFIDELAQIETPQTLRRLADYYSVLSDLYFMVEAVLIEDLETIHPNQNTKNYDRDILNAYGGRADLMKLKDEIHSDLKLIETSIESCLGDKSTCVSEAPLKDEFFLEFYNYLVRTPMPSDILSNEIVSEYPDDVSVDGQLRASIYNKRLYPWRNYFCEASFNDFMCLTEDEMDILLTEEKYINRFSEIMTAIRKDPCDAAYYEAMDAIHSHPHYAPEFREGSIYRGLNGVLRAKFCI